MAMAEATSAPAPAAATTGPSSEPSKPVYPLTAPPKPKHEKLGGYDFYRSIGSPQNVLAPMVEASELVSLTSPITDDPRFRI